MQLVLHQLLLQQRRISGPQINSKRDSKKLFQDVYGKCVVNFGLQNCYGNQIRSTGSKHLINVNKRSLEKSVESVKTRRTLKQEETEKTKNVHAFQKLQTNNLHFPRINNIQKTIINHNKNYQIYSTNSQFQQTSSSSLIQNKIYLKIKNKPSNKKFKKCVKCLMFILKLQKLCKRTLKRTKQMKKLSQNLLKITQKMVTKYYMDILKEPLIHLQTIITNQTRNKPQNLIEELAKNLFSLSQILKTSSLRKDLFKFLTLLTFQRTPLPYDFFCQFQLQRLTFSKKTFQLIQVTELQVKMITGIFLALKVLCIHLFKPILNLSQNQQGPIILNSLISYLYEVVSGLFIKLPCQAVHSIEQLKLKGVEPLNFGKKNLFLYQKMTNDFKRQNKVIENNLNIWISRITKEVMLSRNKLNEQY